MGSETKKSLRRIKNSVYQNLDVEIAYLFGSGASNRAVPESDVDVAILFKGDHKSLELFRNTAVLQREFAKEVERDIDITILNYGSPLLRYEVIRNGMLLYCSDDRLRVEFELRTYREYDDYCHQQDIYFERLRKKLEKLNYDKPASNKRKAYRN